MVPRAFGLQFTSGVARHQSPAPCRAPGHRTKGFTAFFDGGEVKRILSEGRVKEGVQSPETGEKATLLESFYASVP